MVPCGALVVSMWGYFPWHVLNCWYRTGELGCIMHWDINILRPRRNEQHFPDDIFKHIFFNENVWISIKISLKFVPKGPINNIPVLVKIMAWRRSGDKPLSEPMMVSLPTHICVTRPQWVKKASPFCRRHIWMYFLDRKLFHLSQSSLKFARMVPVDNRSAVVRVMTCYRTHDNPFITLNDYDPVHWPMSDKPRNWKVSGQYYCSPVKYIDCMGIWFLSRSCL